MAMQKRRMLKQKLEQIQGVLMGFLAQKIRSL